VTSGRRITARLFFRQYPLKAPVQDGADAERDLARMLAHAYASGVKRGYNAAIDDYFHADENWDSTTPTLHRILGAIKRWYR
jgi:hypothetical protein